MALYDIYFILHVYYDIFQVSSTFNIYVDEYIVLLKTYF